MRSPKRPIDEACTIPECGASWSVRATVPPAPPASCVLPAAADPTALPRFDDALSLLGELRRLSVLSGATELDAPLGRLASACHERWKLTPAPPRLIVATMAVDEAAGAAREFAVTAKIAIAEVRLDEGGEWRIARNFGPNEIRVAKVICFLRPTSCRHVF